MAWYSGPTELVNEQKDLLIVIAAKTARMYGQDNYHWMFTRYWINEHYGLLVRHFWVDETGKSRGSII